MYDDKIKMHQWVHTIILSDVYEDDIHHFYSLPLKKIDVNIYFTPMQILYYLYQVQLTKGIL